MYQKNYKKAIEYYSQCLNVCEGDAHILIIAFFIQNLVEFCGDELEKFYFFFSSFVLLITIAKYFLNHCCPIKKDC